jgi:hypothetical protein
MTMMQLLIIPGTPRFLGTAEALVARGRGASFAALLIARGAGARTTAPIFGDVQGMIPPERWRWQT